MRTNLPQIIYIKPTDSSFIRGDQKILEKEFRVKAFLLNQNKNLLKYFLNLFNLLFFLILNSKKTNIYVTWFADYHAAIMVFAAKIFGIKSYFIL